MLFAKKKMQRIITIIIVTSSPQIYIIMILIKFYGVHRRFQNVHTHNHTYKS